MGPTPQVSITGKGFELVAWLAARESGGFDLLFDREASDMEALTIDQVTQTRKLSTTYGLALIAHFGEARLDRPLQERAAAALIDWLQNIIGFQPTGRYSTGWGTADFEC